MKLKKKWALAFTACVLFLAYSPVAASADSINAVKVLNQHQFESHNIGGDIGRRIGWGVITGLHWLVGGIEDVVYKINSALGGFFTSPGVRNLQQNKIMPLSVALLVLVILFIGILYIIKPRNFTTIVGNLVIGITIAFGLPALLSGGYQLTTQAIHFLDTDSNNKSTENVSSVLSDRILVDNITDNVMYDDSSFHNLTYKNRYAMHGADISDITKIDPTEVIDPGKMQYPDVWKNKLITDKDGKQSLSGLWDGKVGLISIPEMTQYYYRWDIDWFTIISTLIITGFALILSGIKIARLLYELAINQTLTQVVALLDIVTAQRVKRCLQMLLSTLFTLFAVFFMLQVYIIGNAYIAKVSNPFLRLILMVALAWSVIDGPNLFEQIFGIDAGVHNSVRTMYGMKAAGSMMAGAATLVGGRRAMESIRSKGIAGVAKDAVGKAGSFAGGAGGMAAGTVAGAADNRRRYAAAKTGQSNSSGKQAGHNHPSGQTQSSKLSGVDQPGNSSRQDSSKDDMPVTMNSLKKDVESGNPASKVQSNIPTAKSAGNGHSTSSVKSAAGRQNAAASKDLNSNTIPMRKESVSRIPNGVQPGSQKIPNSIPQDQTNESKHPSGTSKGEGTLEQKPVSLGSYAKNKIARSVHNSGAVRSARRMYSLAYGSRMAHGDRKVKRESLAYQKMQDNPEITHRQAVHDAKQEIKQQKDGGQKK